MRKGLVVTAAALLVAGCGLVSEAKRDDTTVASQMLRQDTITNADLSGVWSRRCWPPVWGSPTSWHTQPSTDNIEAGAGR